MLFEIKDLKFATPATVSRAGILYISDDKGYQRVCFIESWLCRFKDENSIQIEFIKKLFDKYIEKIVDYLKKSCKFVVPVSFFSMTSKMCILFEAMIKENKEQLITQHDKQKGLDILDN